jgi:seryl-tRNA synthetase
MNADRQFLEENNMSQYQGPERRVTDIAAFQLMAETRQKTIDLEKSMTDKIDQLKEELDAHIAESKQRHQEAMKSMDELKQSTLAAITGINQIVQDNRKMFMRSVPEGDMDAHRIAHEKWMQKHEKDEKFWSELKTNTAKGLVLLFAVWALSSVWISFLQGPVK